MNNNIFRGNIFNLIIYVPACILIIALCSIAYFAGNSGKTELSDSDVNSIPGSDTEESTLETTYCYYLDISPTMYGFVNSMDTLADLAVAISNLKSQNSTVAYYCCGKEIMAEISSDFYGFMEDPSSMDAYYDDLIEKYAYSEAQEDESDTADIYSMDLSDLFTTVYEDSSSFDGDDTVNVIITDLNFGYTNSNAEDADNSEAEARLESFAENLSAAVVDGSICIYIIDSTYSGFENDEYLETGATLTAASGYSFLIIVFSDNETAYTAYVEDLEDKLSAEGVDTSTKFELTEQVSGDHTLATDQDLFHDTNLSTITNFNYDCQSYEGIDSNALGLQLVKNGNSAEASVAVAEVEIPGYYSADQESDSQLKCVVSLLTTAKSGYETYSDSEDLISCNANLREKDGTWYIQLNFQVQGELADVVGTREYCVMDIQISLNSPDYSVPEWAYEVNEASWNGNYDVTALSSLIETIEEDKEDAYGSMSSYEKYLGNVQIYIGG